MTRAKTYATHVLIVATCTLIILAAAFAAADDLGVAVAMFGSAFVAALSACLLTVEVQS